MDATEIQMVIAQLKPAFDDISIADVDSDGKVSIMDATAIQMQLAKLGQLRYMNLLKLFCFNDSAFTEYLVITLDGVWIH